ncbi:MAG: ornithine cyclodeaminase family protein [Dehalococcoidia bacterium]|nr:ornithine cyclodeaminase family protein [Dehalococcoidia bacterium]
MKVLVLDRAAVEGLLDFDGLIDAVAQGMVDLSIGSVSMPSRVGANVAPHDGLLLAMSAYVPSSATLATKLVTVFPRNAGAGLPSHHAVIAVFDEATGAPIALMDGEHITAARTAACSALATRLLARPDASTMAVLGTGVQARAHALAIPRVRDIQKVRIAGRDPEKAAALAYDLTKQLDMSVTPAASFQDACRDASIVCTTTHSLEPVLRWQWLSPGAHVNCVGLNPQGRELDDETVAGSLVVVESRQAVMTATPPPNDLLSAIRCGLVPEDHIHAEVGELVSGSRPGRTSPDQITLYRSVGVAVQDAVAARLVLDRAREQGVGVTVDL